MKEKTALITGGADRIGAACVQALAAAGVNVVVHYRSSAEKARATRELAAEQGVEAALVRGDLRNEVETRAIFSSACELTGGIDILVNSASVFPESRLEEFGWEELEENLRVHAWAPLILSRLFAAQPRFREATEPIPPERLGDIVNLLDTRIVDADLNHAAYHLSKRSLFSLTRMLSLALAPAVKVNAIAPGLILPPPGKDESYLEKMRETNPLRRYGNPEEISAALLFLVRSSFVTGQVIFVDGGRRLKGSMYGA